MEVCEMRLLQGGLAAGLALLGLLAAGEARAESKAGALLKRIKAVGAEGAGNAEAARAWKELTALGPEALLEVLEALDERDAVSANWLRSAADAIAEKAVAAGRPLPAADLEKFVRQTERDGSARRVAYEWLARTDPKAPGRLLPDLLTDPSPELRRDAVARALDEAGAPLEKKQALASLLTGPATLAAEASRFAAEADRPAVIAAYRKALSGAVDQDQVDAAARALKPLGVEIDLATHFGFVRKWRLAAPFDNVHGVGFKAVYPPEKGVERKATYKGKDGEDVAWTAHETRDRYGNVDLNKELGKKKGAVAYAWAVVESAEERPVEVRAGCINAVKLFLNGKEVFAREEYHHGMRLDQHVGRGVLKKGRNEVLIKVCQNEQKDAWAQQWMFQVRLCDATGVAVPFTQPDEE
jgi:hypothetical protein